MGISATYTLAATTLARPCDRRENVVYVASLSGLTTGTRLYVDREMMTVVGPDVPAALTVRVLRGVDGTEATHHDGGAAVVIGQADQFYSFDPQGAPPEAVRVLPHINIRNGNVWIPQGDDYPVGKALRWWQQATVTYGQGPLGIRTVTYTPVSS